MLVNRIKTSLSRRIFRSLQFPRILKYRILSNCNTVIGRPHALQPVQLVGKGEIEFHGCVQIGYFPSPFFLSGYSYIEARNEHAKVKIGDGTVINNNFVAISEHKSITIGKQVLIGTSVEIYDSNFHGVEPERRLVSHPEEASDVTIEDNVFIASNVKILKGVTIGRDSVIANGAIVTRCIPQGVLAGGNPAKVIRAIRLI